MAIVCTTCNAENPEGADFCEECGIELNAASVSSTSFDSTQPPVSDVAQSESPADRQEPFQEEVISDELEELTSEAEFADSSIESRDDELTDVGVQTQTSGSLQPISHVESARLTLIEFGNPTNTVIPLNFSPVAVGKFDPAQGPIDIDLGHLAGNEYISRRHAELYFDDAWTVRDLGSTNGVFIRKQGQSDFLPRLQTTYRLGDGDEIAFGNMRFIFREAGD